MRIDPRLLVVLTLIAVIGLVTVAPVNSQDSQVPTFDVTSSSQCACFELATYTFHIENPLGAGVTALSIVIPAGYQINPLYLTSTAGVVVATGVGGTVSPRATTADITIKTTATPYVLELFINGFSVGTGTVIPPTPTTPGNLGSAIPPFGANNWGEVTFIAGFLINPCTVGTYNWSPNTATIGATVYTLVPRPGFSNTVTIVNCAVGGFVTPTNKFSIIIPYLALTGLVIAVSAVAVVKRRKD